MKEICGYHPGEFAELVKIAVDSQIEGKIIEAYKDLKKLLKQPGATRQDITSLNNRLVRSIKELKARRSNYFIPYPLTGRMIVKLSTTAQHRVEKLVSLETR